MRGNTKRLFIGSFLSETDRQRFQNARAELEAKLKDEWSCKMRWVRAEKLHMTWLFLGNCDEEQQQSILQTLDALSAQTLLRANDSIIKFDRFDFFPNKDKRRLMALLPNVVPDGFVSVATTLRTKLSAFCEKKEGSSLHPHITIFRFDREDRSKYEIPEDLKIANFAPINLHVGRIALVESHSGTSGDDYRVLREFELSKDSHN